MRREHSSPPFKKESMLSLSALALAMTTEHLSSEMPILNLLAKTPKPMEEKCPSSFTTIATSQKAS